MDSIRQRDEEFLRKAIRLANAGMHEGAGGPFGCVIVKEGLVIAEGYNRVIETNDPTAHAEIVAIRQACHHLGSFQLTGCDVYASCEPCPMCLGAIYWARPARVVFASTREQAAAIEFDDAFIYDEIARNAMVRKIPFIHYPHPEAEQLFAAWKKMERKNPY